MCTRLLNANFIHVLYYYWLIMNVCLLKASYCDLITSTEHEDDIGLLEEVEVLSLLILATGVWPHIENWVKLRKLDPSTSSKGRSEHLIVEKDPNGCLRITNPNSQPKGLASK